MQKRSPDHCVPEAEKAKRRNTPWGEMSYLEYKHRLELSEEQYAEMFKAAEEVSRIRTMCRDVGMYIDV